MFPTQMGGVVVEVSLKVAATKSSVTRQLKKICDTCSSKSDARPPRPPRWCGERHERVAVARLDLLGLGLGLA